MSARRMIGKCGVWAVLLTISASALADSPKKYALLVGVSKYNHASFNEPAPLRFPEIDAGELGDVLKLSGYEIKLLVGRQATQAAIRSALQDLRRIGSEEGVIFLAFFGHGVELGDSKNYFCPYDALTDYVKDGGGQIALDGEGRGIIAPDPKTLVSLPDDIMAGIRLSPAGNKVLVLDACRQDPSKERSFQHRQKVAPGAFGTNLTLNDLPSNTAVLFACRANEYAFENERWGHGAFTKLLLEEFRSVTEDGLGARTLSDKLSQKVQAFQYQQRPDSLVKGTVDLQLLASAANVSRPLVTLTPTRPVDPLPSRPAEPTGNTAGAEGRSAGEERSDNGLGLRLVWCPAGQFTMGSPATETWRSDDNRENQVEVTLSRGFWLGKTEVTQGEWEKVMGTRPWQGESLVREGSSYPATHVSWDDAMEFCGKLTSQEKEAGRLSIGWRYTLPTEAQWEYACRAGSRTAYGFGDDASRLGDYAWYDKNGWDVGEKYAHEVGRKRANAWCLHDMHGNVWEWCSDWYGDRLPGGRDPSGPLRGGSDRVLRGGSWLLLPADARSAARYYDVPENRNSNRGFRLARSSVE